MRIVCPRCVAKYEIDESIIPEIGREVQCENCENIWFQNFVEILPEAGTTKIHQKDQTIFDKVDDKPEATFYSSRGLDLNKDDTADGKFNNDVDDTFGSEKGEDDIPATNITMPPTIAEVLEVLRSEAIFSSSRNQFDAKARNTLNYNETEHNESEVNEATLSALPNEGNEAVALKGSRDGFRYAFIWTVFIIALFIASYILRPELVAALPHAAIVLDPYAAAIDYIRIVINGLLI